MLQFAKKATAGGEKQREREGGDLPRAARVDRGGATWQREATPADRSAQCGPAAARTCEHGDTPAPPAPARRNARPARDESRALASDSDSPQRGPPEERPAS